MGRKATISEAEGAREEPRRGRQGMCSHMSQRDACSFYSSGRDGHRVAWRRTEVKQEGRGRHNIWKNSIAPGHDMIRTNWKMVDESTSARPWASVYILTVTHQEAKWHNLRGHDSSKAKSGWRPHSWKSAPLLPKYLEYFSHSLANEINCPYKHWQPQTLGPSSPFEMAHTLSVECVSH